MYIIEAYSLVFTETGSWIKDAEAETAIKAPLTRGAVAGGD